LKPFEQKELIGRSVSDGKAKLPRKEAAVNGAVTQSAPLAEAASSVGEEELLRL